MLKIAIIDDEQAALMISKSVIESFFKEHNVEFQLFAFSSPENLLASEVEEKFDLVFLDIDLPSMSGLEIAKKLIEVKKDTQIIFLSQREDLVFECLKFHPFGFIRKSKIIEDFNLMMNQFYNTFLNNDDKDTRLDIVDKTKTMSFKINEIVYIEGDRNYQNVVLKDGSSHNVRIPLGNLEERLKGHGFLRIHKGYLVNYLFIRSIVGDEVILTNGTKLPMSKKRKEETMKQYLSISRKKEAIII